MDCWPRRCGKCENLSAPLLRGNAERSSSLRLRNHENPASPSNPQVQVHQEPVNVHQPIGTDRQDHAPSPPAVISTPSTPQCQSLCAISRRPIATCSNGLIQLHGPVNSRCAGSHHSPIFHSTPHDGSTSNSSQSQTGPPTSFPPPNQLVKVLKRIPKASRASCARKLTSILEAVVASNDQASWHRLLSFPKRCLRTPLRGGKHWSLSSIINKQLNEESDLSTGKSLPRRNLNPPHDLAKTSASGVSSKLEEGDFKGAIRLASTEDTLAEWNDSMFSGLCKIHPDTVIPPLPDDFQHTTFVSVKEVAQAIRSFPNGSAGGVDGLRPQHLKDMIGSSSSDGAAQALLSALTSFIKLVLQGETPLFVHPIFFGATLTALRKKGGGIRPIAVGCTLCRLAAKVAGGKVMEDMGNLLAPCQLGYGVKRGVEAAVHSARLYLKNLQPGHLLLKLDFRNAFNSIHRDKMLEVVRNLVPDLLALVHSTYSSPSSLFGGDKTLLSSEGVQQGDPLGPLLFCLSIHP